MPQSTAALNSASFPQKSHCPLRDKQQLQTLCWFLDRLQAGGQASSNASQHSHLVLCHIRLLFQFPVFIQPQVTQLELEHVIGLSAPNPQVAALSPANDQILAYAAGSFIVLYDLKRKKQLQVLRIKASARNFESSSSLPPVATLTWSFSGRYLASGEGSSPAAILLWDIATGSCLDEFKAHQHPITSMSISRDGKHLRSCAASKLGASQAAWCAWQACSYTMKNSSITQQHSSIAVASGARILLEPGSA